MDFPWLYEEVFGNPVKAWLAAGSAFVVLVAYYGSVAAFRLGLDPDNHGIPLITSSMDLVGPISLIIALLGCEGIGDVIQTQTLSPHGSPPATMGRLGQPSLSQTAS